MPRVRQAPAIEVHEMFRVARSLGHAITLLTLAVWPISWSPTFADCPGTDIDTNAVRSLIDAKDVSTLDSLFSHMNSDDAALLAVYRKKRLALHRTNREEIRFLTSLPKTVDELSRVYQLVDTQGLCGDPFVTEVVYDMFDSAAKIVRDRGRNHREFIELCNLTDGEAGEVAWPAFDWLLEHDTSRTVSALRSLDEQLRIRLCDGQDPRHLRDDQAALECRSGL